PCPRQTSGEPRRNFAVRNSSTRERWFEAVGGRRLARTRLASRAGWRLPQSHHRLQHSLQPGMNSRPPSCAKSRRGYSGGARSQLNREERQILYVSSTRSAFTETLSTVTPGCARSGILTIEPDNVDVRYALGLYLVRKRDYAGGSICCIGPKTWR